MERELKRNKYLAEAAALTNNLENVREALIEFEDSAGLFRHTNQTYSSEWSGKTREAYDSLVEELNQTEQIVYDVHRELMAEINSEIDRLFEKVRELK
ncbi:conserved hypothetical protein [Bacillus sp. 349Y]|nr:conserved hypothetical protein [Bacillus sp. 349Y]